MASRLDAADRRVLLVVLLGALAFWLWLAFGVHTLLVIGGECDGYVNRAASLLAGQVVLDGFHPLGLPVLIAAVGLLGVEPFVAGRLVVVATGLVLVACTFLIARTFATRATAAGAAIAVAASEFVLVGAVQVCSDIPAAAFVAVALYCWTRATSGGAVVRWLFVGGLALGYAGFIRTPVLVFAPAMLPLLAGVPWRERIGRAAAAVAGVFCGYAPHLVLSWYSGVPLKNASQLVWKYQRLTDQQLIEYLGNPPPFPWADVPRWCVEGLGDLVGYLGRGFGGPWSGNAWKWLAIVVSVAFTAAMLRGLWRREPVARVLAIGAWCYVLALCGLTIPESRLTVPMALPAVLLAVHAVASSKHTARTAPWCAAVLAGAALWAAPAALGRFERAHPRAEASALRQLAAEHGDWFTVAVAAIGLERAANCVAIPILPAADDAKSAAQAWQLLLADVRIAGADFVLVGRTTAPRLYQILASGDVPAGREWLRRDDVLLVARAAGAGQLIAAAEVLVRGDMVEMHIRLVPGTDAAQFLAVGFLYPQQVGELRHVPLLPAGDGNFVATVASASLARAPDCQFVPALLSHDGIIRRGKPVAVRTAPVVQPPSGR